MKLRHFLFALIAFFPTVTFAAGATISPVGPKTVTVGQTFSLNIAVKNAVDADTFRINGTFPSDLLRWVGASPSRDSLNVSPGSSGQSSGSFSYGVFSLGKTVDGSATVANLTFTALKPGTAVIALSPTSRVLSAGVDQLTGQSSISIKILPKTAAEAVSEATIGLISASHPNETLWYPSRDLTVSWNAQQLSGYRVMIGFDQSPQGPAEQLVPGDSWSTKVPSDGVWYVHLKAVSPDGTVISTTFRVQIDSTSPRKLVPVTEQDNVPSTIPNALYFAAIDDTSGIDYYDIFIDGQFVASTTANQWPLPTLSIGQHMFEVVAYDRAGNSTSGSGYVTVVKTPGILTIKMVAGAFVVSVVAAIAAFGFAAWLVWFCFGRRKRKK